MSKQRSRLNPTCFDESYFPVYIFNKAYGYLPLYFQDDGAPPRVSERLYTAVLMVIQSSLLVALVSNYNTVAMSIELSSQATYLTRTGFNILLNVFYMVSLGFLASNMVNRALMCEYVAVMHDIDAELQILGGRFNYKRRFWSYIGIIIGFVMAQLLMTIVAFAIATYNGVVDGVNPLMMFLYFVASQIYSEYTLLTSSATLEIQTRFQVTNCTLER